MEDTIALFETIIRRRVSECRVRGAVTGDANIVASLQTLLFSAKFDVRFYALSADQQLASLWESIREDEEQLDFVMGLRSEFRVHLGYSEWVNFVQKVCTGLVVDEKYEGMSVVDDDTLSRFPRTNWIYDAFCGNDWVVILYIIHITQLPMELINGQ